MWVKKEGHISHIIPGDFMWVEDEEWNSFMTHLFLCGLYKKVFYFYLAQVVFQYLKKMCVRGGGLGAGPQVFCWYAKANLGRFLK